MRLLIILTMQLFSIFSILAQDHSDHGTDTIFSFEEIVVTSTRKSTAQKNLPYSAAVLKRKNIDRLQSRTTPEALSGMTGVFVQKTNHGGGSAFIRGLTGNQTLTMIDGIRLNNPTFRYGPNQYLNTIDQYNIAKIELVKGSGSVQYGSDAMGGVIQVFTKEPEFSDNDRLITRLIGKAMTQNMEYTGRAELEYQSERLSVLVGGTLRDFGDLVGGDTSGFQSPSGYNERSFNAKLKWKLGTNSMLTLAHQYTGQYAVPLYHKIKLENFETYFFDPQIRALSYLRFESENDHRLLKKISFTSSLQNSKEARKYHKINADNRFEEIDVVATVGHTFDVLSILSKRWSFNSGIEHYYSKIGSDRSQININTEETTGLRGLYPDQAKSHNFSIYSLHHLEFNHLLVEGGLRYNFFSHKIPNDDPFLADGKNIMVSPSSLVANLAGVYSIAPHHSIFISYSSGYRAPNIDDLGTLGLVDFRYEVPAYELSPEKSYTTELGYRWLTDHLNLGVSLFNMRLTDLISRRRLDDQQVNGYNVYIKENSQNSYIRGFEFSFDYQIINHWLFKSTTTYTYGQNKSAGEPMRRIPPLFGRNLLSYQKTRFSITLEHLYAGKQDRLAKGDMEDNRIPVGGTPGWTTLNTYSDYLIKNGLTLRLGLQNLFNSDYRYHGSGINGVGRSAWVAVEVEIG
ncbi:MAG: TonB-dependent receptor [Saprospiraceae bacterium]|nr:TonB-dependent receptor [Saprospiraceae bacterium]